MSVILALMLLLQVREGAASRDSGAVVRDSDPNRPTAVTRPADSGTYRVTIRTTTESDPEATDRWSAGKYTERTVDVTVDPSRHCRIYLVDGEWVRAEEEDYVILQTTKR